MKAKTIDAKATGLIDSFGSALRSSFIYRLLSAEIPFRLKYKLGLRRYTLRLYASWLNGLHIVGASLKE